MSKCMRAPRWLVGGLVTSHWQVVLGAGPGPGLGVGPGPGPGLGPGPGPGLYGPMYVVPEQAAAKDTSAVWYLPGDCSVSVHHGPKSLG